MQLCPSLPAGKIEITGDLVDERDADRSTYAACAAKMAGVVKWRAAHSKGN